MEAGNGGKTIKGPERRLAGCGDLDSVRVRLRLGRARLSALQEAAF